MKHPLLAKKKWEQTDRQIVTSQQVIHRTCKGCWHHLRKERRHSRRQHSQGTNDRQQLLGDTDTMFVSSNRVAWYFGFDFDCFAFVFQSMPFGGSPWVLGSDYTFRRCHVSHSPGRMENNWSGLQCQLPLFSCVSKRRVCGFFLHIKMIVSFSNITYGPVEHSLPLDDIWNIFFKPP